MTDEDELLDELEHQAALAEAEEYEPSDEELRIEAPRHEASLRQMRAMRDGDGVDDLSLVTDGPTDEEHERAKELALTYEPTAEELGAVEPRLAELPPPPQDATRTADAIEDSLRDELAYEEALRYEPTADELAAAAPAARYWQMRAIERLLADKSREWLVRRLAELEPGARCHDEMSVDEIRSRVADLELALVADRFSTPQG